MSTLHILVSGDYWHDDFRDQFSSIDCPATMVPLERIETAIDRDYQLIVLAQSRRDQIPQATVDGLRAKLPDVPIVVLLGSWCEGANRSGNPLIGVNQVPWHQWDSRFEKFCTQIRDGVKSDWHLPLTASVSDRVRDFTPAVNVVEELSGCRVLVSAQQRSTFESIADLLKFYQCTSRWAESLAHSQPTDEVDVLLVDGNTASEELVDRILELNSRCEDVPVIAMLNFPRKRDMGLLSEIGVEEVVSKPFTPDELVIPMSRATRNRTTKDSHIA